MCAYLCVWTTVSPRASRTEDVSREHFERLEPWCMKFWSQGPAFLYDLHYPFDLSVPCSLCHFSSLVSSTSVVPVFHSISRSHIPPFPPFAQRFSGAMLALFNWLNQFPGTPVSALFSLLILTRSRSSQHPFPISLITLLSQIPAPCVVIAFSCHYVPDPGFVFNHSVSL